MDELHDQERATLDELAKKFLQALHDKDNGRLDEAEDALRDILQTEPRLPEPHMELARILVDSDRLTDAETHAREALEKLEARDKLVKVDVGVSPHGGIERKAVQGALPHVDGGIFDHACTLGSLGSGRTRFTDVRLQVHHADAAITAHSIDGNAGDRGADGRVKNLTHHTH